MGHFGSDLVVDLLVRYGIRFASINPGSTARGLHDSLVNYGADEVEMVECPHEEIAVGMAHGYAKATGSPMAAVVHDLVGLLHCNMALYYAYLDRVPLILLGGASEMDAARRRPRIDWDHAALIQGTAVRDHVKWDDQPFSVDAIPESFARAYRIAVTPPGGPVYVALEAGLQEERIDRDIPLIGPAGVVPAPMAPDPSAVSDLAEALLGARHPVVVADNFGRNQGAVPYLGDLAELLGCPVVDRGGRLNLTSTHPLWFCTPEPLDDADLVLALDMRDLEGPLHHPRQDKTNMVIGPQRPREGFRLFEMGLTDLAVNGWAQHFQRFRAPERLILCDTDLGVRHLLSALRQQLQADPDRAAMVEARAHERRTRWGSQHDDNRRRWEAEALAVPAEARPLMPARLAYELREALRGEDWVLAANTMGGWALRLWDFDQPYRHVGEHLGTGTQIGISLGVALAYRGTGKLVVDVQPDGDLMFDLGALWVAAHQPVPMLVVMYNNRAYQNDYDHQIAVARMRGRDETHAHVGQELDRPAPDFAGVARSLGWHAEGPIDDIRDVRVAIQRAIRVVRQGRPALVDCVVALSLEERGKRNWV